MHSANSGAERVNRVNGVTPAHTLNQGEGSGDSKMDVAGIARSESPPGDPSTIHRFLILLQQPRAQLFLFCLGTFGLFLLLTFRLNFSSAWAFGDHYPFPTASFQEWSAFSYSWNWTSIGLAGSGGTLQGVLLGPITAGVPFDGALLVAFLPFSALAMFWFLRQYVPSSYAVVAALLFAINPVTVATFTGGSGGIDGGYLELYAIFPLYLGVILSTLSGDTRLCTPSLVAVGVALGLAGTDLPALFWMYGPPTLILIVLVFLLQSQYLARFLARTVLTFAVALPLLLLALQIYGTVGTNPATYTSYAATSSGYIYNPASILNLLRAAGSNGDAQFLLGYNSPSWWTFIGLLVTVAALAGLGRLLRGLSVKNILQIFSAALLVAGLALASAVKSGALLQLMSTNSIVAGLDDIERVQFWIILSLSVLLPSGLEIIESSIRKLTIRVRHSLPRRSNGPRFMRWALSRGNRSSALRYGLCAAVVTAILVSNSPALDGSLGLVPVRGSSYLSPSYYSAVTHLVQTGALDVSQFRTLWLPYTSNDLARQHWFSTFELNPPYEMNFFNPAATYVTSLYDGICQYNQTSGLQELLSLWGVHYIIVDWNESRQLAQSLGSTPCAVPVSPVFTSFEAVPSFLQMFLMTLTAYHPIFQSPNLSIYSANTPALAYIGAEVPQSAVHNSVTPIIPSTSENLALGGTPFNLSNWAFWPSATLASQITVGGVPSLRLNLSSLDLTVSQQVLPVNASREYLLQYQVLEGDAYARARILWYSNSTSLLDGTPLRIDYFPSHLTPLSITSATNYSASAMPPIGASVATLQLLIGGPSSFADQNLSAVFANISLRSETWKLNNATLIPQASPACQGVMEATSASQVIISDLTCVGNFSLVLSTAYNLGWAASIQYQEGASQPATNHGIGNYVFNEWSVNLKPGASITISFTSDSSRSIQVLGALAYIPAIIALPFLLKVYIERRRKSRALRWRVERE
jgi:hypothetical protein